MLKGLTAPSGGITPGTTVITGGTNTRVLFDDNGVVGESAGLTYVKSTGTLTATVLTGGNVNATAAGTSTTLASTVTGNFGSRAAGFYATAGQNNTVLRTNNSAGVIVTDGFMLVASNQGIGFLVGTNPDINIAVGNNIAAVFEMVSANVVSLGNGSGSSLGQLQVLTVKTVPVLVSGLPAAATAGAGSRAFVTDSTTTTTLGIGLAVVGTGGNSVPVYSDGANWIIG